MDSPEELAELHMLREQFEAARLRLRDMMEKFGIGSREFDAAIEDAGKILQRIRELERRS